MIEAFTEQLVKAEQPNQDSGYVRQLETHHVLMFIVKEEINYVKSEPEISDYFSERTRKDP